MIVISLRDLFCLVSFLMASHPIIADDSNVAKLSNSVNKFGIDLFAVMSNINDNILISPLSISVALNALLEGSQGTTADEINSVFDFNSTGLSRTQIREAFKTILTNAKNNNSNYANSVWIKQGVNVQSQFKSDIQNYFNTEEKEVDFASPSATSEINNWISQQTKGNIKKALQSNTTQNTSLILASANYFKGIWATSFNPSFTIQEPFFVNGGDVSIPVDMMYIDGNFSYTYDVDTNSELIEIPYDGDDVTMVIVLPKEVNGIKNQEQHFTLENVNLALGEMSVGFVHLRIPKFKISFSQILNQNLTNMGIKEAFVPGKADLSKIDGSKDLSVSKFVQAGWVEIDESGSAPAAKTKAPAKITNYGYEFPKEEYVTVDHPFGFLIRHKPSGVIYFIGRVMHP